MAARLFTLGEANRLLPRLREILTAIQEGVAALERVQETVVSAQWRLRRNGHTSGEEPSAPNQDARRVVQERLRELDELGVELKDPRLGLVDFPSEREGEVVYLCWKLDEPEIAWWHPIDTGFAGRRPL